MVEAGVLAPIFTMFWLLMMQISGTYQYKILCNLETRYQAFHMGVNDCASMGEVAPQPVTSQLGAGAAFGDPNTPSPPATPGVGGVPGFPIGPFFATVSAQATYDYRPPDKTKGDKIEINNATDSSGGGVFKLLPTSVHSESRVICSPGNGADENTKSAPQFPPPV